jgi:hypothetical protein
MLADPGRSVGVLVARALSHTSRGGWLLIGLDLLAQRLAGSGCSVWAE